MHGGLLCVFGDAGAAKRAGITDEKFEEMAEKCTFYGKRTLPSYVPLGKSEILEIFRLAES